MIFVAGATGYTGKFVVDALVSAGESVRCLARETSRTEHLARVGAAVVRGDLERPEDLAASLAGCEALVSAAHIRYAPALIRMCREAGVRRVVLLSSTWRFCRVRTAEVEAVIAGETAVEASDLEATVLRPTMIYGPGDDRNVSRMRAYLRQHRVMPIFGSGERLVQPVYVADVADAVVSVIGRSGTVGRAYEVAGAHPMTYQEMVDALARAVGRTVLKVYIPISLAVPMIRACTWAAGRFSVTVDQVRRMGEDRAFDISEAVCDFGFAPRGFEDGLREAMRLNGEDEV